MEKQFPTIDKVRTGNRIRQLMNSLGLTVIDVQKYMGFSTQQAVYHWLNGRSIPTLDNIYALSELFRVPMDQIICGSRKYQPEYGSMYYRIEAYVDFMHTNLILPQNRRFGTRSYNRPGLALSSHEVGGNTCG